jgi:hypothetical protein
VNQLTAQRSSRVLYVLGAAIFFAAAVPAKTANLVDVRVGLHDKYTRVVLETDAKASCDIASSGSEELVLSLGAGSGTRVVPSAKSAHLVSVAVRPVEPGASEIRIALRGPVDVKKMVLSAPPRIVLDLRAAPDAGAAAPSAKPPAPMPPQPEPALEEPSELAAAPSAPAQEPEALTEAPAEAAPEEPAEAPEKEEAAAPSLSEPDPGAVLPAREAPRKPAPPPRRPSTPPSRAVTPPPPVAGGGLLAALPGPLGEPLVLAAIAVVLLLVIAFLVLRRRGAAAEEEPITPFGTGEPFSVDEKPEVAEEAEGAEADAEADADLPVRPGAEAETSLFDQPVESMEPVGQQEDEAAAEDRDEVVAAAPAAGPVPGPDPSGEMERRLARLEERLEEVVDEKERLGRQVAAQTEELRVQRAAIARTQRVLRDLTRPPDEPTEPAPKT